jgi:hypothetical protein
MAPAPRKPGPAPVSMRSLARRISALERQAGDAAQPGGLTPATTGERVAYLERLGPARRVEELQLRMRVAELEERNAELEHLARTGYSGRGPARGPEAFPLSRDQLADLRQAKRDDDLELAREVLADAWQAWDG